MVIVCCKEGKSITPQRGEEAAAAISHYSPALYLIKMRPASLNEIFPSPTPALRVGFDAFCCDGHGGMCPSLAEESASNSGLSDCIFAATH